MLRSRITLVAKNEYLDAKYNDISSYHLDGIEDDDTKKKLKKKLMESIEVRRDLLDVIDVPDLTEDERQARMKPARKPRKDKGSKRKGPLRDMARQLIEHIEAVEKVSTDDFVYDTYPQVVVKLKDFLARDGVTQAMMCKVLGGICNTLTLFLSRENVNKEHCERSVLTPCMVMQKQRTRAVHGKNNHFEFRLLCRVPNECAFNFRSNLQNHLLTRLQQPPRLK